MEFTSERIIPNYYFKNLSEFMLYLMHIKSYLALENIVCGNVLDYGCGLGYGTNILKNFSDNVLGIDIDKNAIAFAKEKFSAKNIEFQLLDKDYKELPFESNCFDNIISFQVIEHIKDTDRYLKEINRVLKRGGYFICTTPNAKMRLYPYQKPWNQHHIKEYNYYNLSKTIEKYFHIKSLEGIRLSPIYQKMEKKRVWIRKNLMYPFTSIFIPEYIRIKILHYIWSKTIYKKSTKGNDIYDREKYINNVIIDNNLINSFSFFVIAQKI